MIPQVVFVLGGPGAGKGTQCQNIIKEFDFVHLSVGDLLREESNRPGSKFREMIDEKIVNGQIIPAEITCGLIEDAIMKSEKGRFLIDGFPRNEDNLDEWTKVMSKKTKLLFVMFFDCSQEDCVKRCLGRGASGSGRSDDNLESLKKRFNTYINETMPIIKRYEKLNLVKKIDASAEPYQVFLGVMETFKAAGVSRADD